MKHSLTITPFKKKTTFCSRAILALTLFFSPVIAKKQDINKNEYVLDSFSSQIGAGVPTGWHPSRKDVTMFSIQQENGERFLRVKTKGGCTSIGKQHNFSSDKYPLLTWKWRVHKLPDGGDETQRKKNDSGAGIYVFFKGNFKLNNIIKYVWSSTLSKGTITSSPYNSRTRIVVLRSGTQQTGKWICETVNIQEDYRKLFGKNPPPVEGIGILSDSDNSGSEVMADYDEIKITKSENLASNTIGR